MTTIAYKDGVMAADSQITEGNLKYKSDLKIKYLNRFTIVSCAGEVGDIVALLEFMKDEDWPSKLKDSPKVWKKTEGIVAYKGEIYTFRGPRIHPVPLAHKFYACGSGWQVAMAAMHMGLSALDAVKTASELDIYTNGEIQVVNVKELSKGPQTRKAKQPGV